MGFKLKKKKGMKPVNRGLLYEFESMMKNKIIPHVPMFLTTRRLTMMTLLWAVLIVIVYSHSRYNIALIHLASLLIVFQYITDVLDGGVGRYRNEGLVKWGFYMDHFLDGVFFSSICLGYYFVFQGSIYPFLIMAIVGLFFMNAFLKYGLFDKLELSFGKFSVTEMRLLVILVNTLIYFGFGEIINKYVFPAFLVVCVVVLFLDVVKTQRKIYNV